MSEGTLTLKAPEEVLLAKESSRTLSSLIESKENIQIIYVEDDRGNRHQVNLPASALRLLTEILAELGSGNSVQVFPLHAILTTQEAANLLNVSRPFLVKLLKQGEIPYHKTGSHRRLALTDVLAYKENIDEKRSKTLDELVAISQELGLGY
ncbi:MAG: helix-turn-helix domain-containing protein [Acidobacteria bacterium]|nr:helix-turn-helix domain-containing protein [Acidobacteriota bacterium]MCB9398550.1 helix-turn-helix domain-containing protein [Acidobacteriota bacterium]